MEFGTFEWFAQVNARLNQIEQENKARFTASGDLFAIEAIRHSTYWHPSDERATRAWFDWNPVRFPKHYDLMMSTAISRQIAAHARVRYHENPAGVIDLAIENTKIMVARLWLVNERTRLLTFNA